VSGLVPGRKGGRGGGSEGEEWKGNVFSKQSQQPWKRLTQKGIRATKRFHTTTPAGIFLGQKRERLRREEEEGLKKSKEKKKFRHPGEKAEG